MPYSAIIIRRRTPRTRPGPARPPVAVDDSASTHSAAVTLAVLANDSDPDGDKLTVTAVGTCLDGTVTYTANPGTSGIDEFTYTISDGHGNTSLATVFVNIA
jgi:hypothetical protein